MNHDEAAPSTLQPIGHQCSFGSCPTVYEIDDGSNDIAVQGFVLPDAAAPEGEQIVRIPRSLLESAASELKSRSS